MFECSLMSTLYLKKYGYIILCVKVSKCGVFSGPYFPAFGLIRKSDTEYLSVFSSNAGKYGPGKTPYLDTFHAVNNNHTFSPNVRNTDQKKLRIWTLFTQCFVINDQNSSGLFYSNLESLRLQFY